MTKNKEYELSTIDTSDFFKIMQKFKTDSRFEKKDMINILEGIWDTDDIETALVDFINANNDNVEYQDLIDELEEC